MKTPLSAELDCRQLVLGDQVIDRLDIELEQIGNLSCGQKAILHPEPSVFDRLDSVYVVNLGPGSKKFKKCKNEGLSDRLGGFSRRAVVRTVGRFLMDTDQDTWRPHQP